METDRDLEVLAAVSAHFVDTCEGIAEHHWPLQTPCPEWSLADLIDHVTGGNRFTVRILDGERAAGALALTRQSFASGHAGKDDAVSAMESLASSFLAPGVLERSVEHVAGELTGRQVLHLRMHDLIVHTWDIRQTVDPPGSLPAELVAWGREELSSPESLTADHFGAHGTGTVSDTSDPLALYLAAFGR